MAERKHLTWAQIFRLQLKITFKVCKNGVGGLYLAPPCLPSLAAKTKRAEWPTAVGMGFHSGIFLGRVLLPLRHA